MSRILDETQLCNGPVEVLAKQGEILNMFKRVSKRIGRARAKGLRQQKRDLETRRLRAMQRIQELKLHEQPTQSEIESMTSVFNMINTEWMCMFKQNAQAAKDQNSHQYSTTP